MTASHRSTAWMVGSGAFWFAQSFKWFILILLVLPGQVASLVPETEKNTALGLVTGVGAIWATIGPFLFGFLSYKIRAPWGRQRTFLVVGGLLTCVGLAALASSPSLPLLIASYLLLQIADDIGTGPYAALIPERVAENQRGKASGVLGTLRFLAQVVGAVFGAMLAKNVTGIYVGIAVVNLICLGITLLFLKGEPPFEPESASSPTFGVVWQEFAEPWRSRDFTLVFVITWIGNLGYYLIQTYLQNFFRDRIPSYEVFGTILDLKVFIVNSPETAMMFLGLMISVVAIGGALLSSRLTDRLGRKRSIVWGGLMMACVLVPFALKHDFSLIVMLAPIFAIGMGIYQSASWALVSDILPNPDRLGKDMGIWQASFSSVQVGAGAVGVLIDKLNSASSGLGYSALFLMGAALVGLGTMLVGRVKGSS